MQERAFKGLKRTVMHVSGLPPPCFDIKNEILSYSFLNQNMMVEDLRHA